MNLLTAPSITLPGTTHPWHLTGADEKSGVDGGDDRAFPLHTDAPTDVRSVLTRPTASPSTISRSIRIVRRPAEMFFADACLCGVSALALGTNAPNLLRSEAHDYRTPPSGFGSAAGVPWAKHAVRTGVPTLTYGCIIGFEDDDDRATPTTLPPGATSTNPNAEGPLR